MEASSRVYRIGELSRRVGVAPETLRAWERRYALLDPARTQGGYRLYDSADEARIRMMARLRSEGMAAAEAAKLVREVPHLAGQAGQGAVEAGLAVPSQADASVAGRLASTPAGAGDRSPAPAGRPAPWASDDDRNQSLAEALESFDDVKANRIFDAAVGELGVSALVDEVVLPTLRGYGERWEAGETTIAQEHFASNFFQGRLLGLARGWGGGRGPMALLACAPGERHDLGLLAFGLILHERGWRIIYLGIDTPLHTVDEAARQVSADAVVVAAIEGRRLRAVADELRDLGRAQPVYIAGAGASSQFANRIGVRLLETDPTGAAGLLDGEFAAAAA